MDIESLINSIRTQYLDAYKTSIAEYTAKFNPGGPEVLIERESVSGGVFGLYRIDLASGSVDPPDFTEVNPESYVSFESLEFSLNGMEIRMHPIYWNGVEFELSPRIEQEEVERWAKNWIDVEETSDLDEYGLGNYIHSITEPSISKGKQVFSVDFGSSEVGALFELLELISRGGATSLCMLERVESYRSLG